MTIAAILLILKRIFYFVVDNWKVVAAVVAAIAVIVIVQRACAPRPAKLNEAEIQQSINAVEQRNDAKLKEILVNADLRERQIDANLANADVEKLRTLSNSRERYKNMNTSDLAAEIERRK